MYNQEEASKRLFERAMTELNADGDDWTMGENVLGHQADPVTDLTYWATTVKNQKTGQVRAVNFNIWPSEDDTVAIIKRAIKSDPQR